MNLRDEIEEIMIERIQYHAGGWIEGRAEAADAIFALVRSNPPAPPEGWQMPPDKWVRDYAKKHCTTRTGDHWKADAWNLTCAFRAWAEAHPPAPPEGWVNDRVRQAYIDGGMSALRPIFSETWERQPNPYRPILEASLAEAADFYVMGDPVPPYLPAAAPPAPETPE
jgi:hypothetical protein